MNGLFTAFAEIKLDGPVCVSARRTVGGRGRRGRKTAPKKFLKALGCVFLATGAAGSAMAGAGAARAGQSG
jgi:hypothetical protein